jgi:non-ribosomal peptide synthetase component F
MSQANSNEAGPPRTPGPQPGIVPAAAADGSPAVPGHYARPMRRPGADLDLRTQALLAALAAIELQTRLDRPMPVTVLDHHAAFAPNGQPAAPLPPSHRAADAPPGRRAAGTPFAPAGAAQPAAPAAWHWTSWPAEALQPLCARDALSLLARSRQTREPEQALRVELAHQPAALDIGTAAVRLWCRLGDEMLSVICLCNSDDPWAPASSAIAEIYAEILHALLTQPHIKASQAPGAGRTSLQLVLGPQPDLLPTAGGFRAIPQLIEDSVAAHPARIALECGDQQLTYQAFDQLATAWAARLAARGVVPGALVPVLLPPGLALPVAWYALMKLGAAFVPLDMHWPAERLEQALALLASRVVVCAHAQALPSAWQTRALPLDLQAPQQDARHPGRAPGPDDLIYGFFTPAPTATARAQCALNHHGGLANRFRFMSRYFHRERGTERVLLTAAPSDDAAFWQLMWPLTTGGTVVMAPPAARTDAGVAIDAIARHSISLVAMEPDLLDRLAARLERDGAAAASLASLREIVIGSEAVRPQAVEALRAALPALRITRTHGPTETSIGVLFHPLEAHDDAASPRGRPIDNCYVVVVDRELRPLPPGACGHLLIGGACVGSGYLHDPAATAHAFIDNPFPTLPGARLYRTGDHGRLDARGRLHVVRRGERAAPAATRPRRGSTDLTAAWGLTRATSLP